MAEKQKIYEFEDYRVDVDNNVLTHKGAVIPLTPKVFDTLIVLIENSGKLVEKNVLMELIWHDRFVEESNLTFNIKMLRKALGDNAAEPAFIETVPRKGYRFIAEVKEGLEKQKVEPLISQEIKSTALESRAKLSQFIGARHFLIVILLVALVGLLAGIGLTWQKQTTKANAPVLSSEFTATKLSETGEVRNAVISPDGKYIAYTNQVNNKQSLWIRQLATSNNTQILPSSSEIYFGLAFSHDSETLFFTRQIISRNEPMSLFRVPITGGVPKKIAENCQGWISVSPDDRQVSFVRYEEGISDHNYLMLVDVDGKNERRLKVSETPNVFWANAFSPDGKKVAAVYGYSKNASRNIGIDEIDAETENQREITPEKFFQIPALTWLPNKSGLLFSGYETIGDAAKIWKMDYESGSVKDITKDSISYGDLSLNKTADKIVATIISKNFHLFVGDVDKAGDVKDLTQARDGLTFAPDGRIVYASDTAGSEDIWIMNADGTNQRQLTVDRSLDWSPLVSPDNRYIFFTSNRTGESQIWRMNLDGSNQIQITRKEGGYPRFVTPDGKWLYYQSVMTKIVWKVSIEGGDETQVLTEQTGDYCAFSPDGKQMAYFYKNKDKQGYTVVLLSLENQAIIKRYPAPEKESFPRHLKWTGDGKTLTYITDNGFEKLSLWAQNLDEAAPSRIQDLGNGEIMDCQFSFDGKTYAFIRGNWKHDAVLLTGLK